MDINLWKAEIDEVTHEVTLQFRDALPVDHPNPVDWRASKSTFVTLSGLGTIVPDPAPQADPPPASE